MRKKKEDKQKSIFTDLEKDITRENQVYINEEIMDAVLDAKKEQAKKGGKPDAVDDIVVQSTISRTENPESESIEKGAAELENTPQEEIEANDANEIHDDDLGIYDSLFSETTIVSTQIYTYEIDKNLGHNNFSTSCSYRVGQDTTELGSIFTITRKELDKPLNFSKPTGNSDISWYNDLASLGYSYAAVYGTSVQGVVICEPQLWNNTLCIRHLSVNKKERLKGIGRKLIDECVNRAQAEGFRAITLEVVSSNGAAIDFYTKMNFNIVGLNVGLYSNSDILKEDVAIFMSRIIV
ncbi:MAG: GNAT family N-acetyltransferase [Eubacteriales bacterium]